MAKYKIHYPTIERTGDKEPASSEVYTLLKDLTLYEFYKLLDNELVKEYGSDVRCDYCKNQIASYQTNGKELIDLCKKCCNIILSVHDILDKCKASDDKKKCQYMSHWLYDKVVSITQGTNLFINFYAVLSMYSSSNKDNFKNCTLTDFNIDKETFNKKHILYEFIESYDDMKNKIDNKSKLYTPLYCKHIKENFLFYNVVKNECTSNESCGYFNELNEFKEKFRQQDVLSFIYEKCEYTKTSCKHGSNSEDDVPCLQAKGIPFILPILGNDPDDIINILLNVAIISVPFLAIFLILFKFTPFGRKLNRINAKGRKSGSKKKEENIEDYMNNYAAYVDNVMKNRVNLTYHAS
ncbi:VIR protein [Plasmodium vivax]|uniref:VIR protein n=1 Tax=Plasmodium vivax TaxID=5855 RepID=A0A1G4EC63_PLAVI|nr:VIR protein [Plasmodium vivax]